MEKLNEFADSWVKSQKEFMENWTESIKKLQASFMNMGGSQDGPTKEIFSLYNPWLTAMLNASKVFTGESEKTQDTWEKTVENKMARAER